MIVWVDIETTGLDPQKDHILEVAVVVTDDNAFEKASTSALVKPVGCSIADLIPALHPRVVEMHTKNGLFTDLMQEVPPGGPLCMRKPVFRRYEAEQYLLDFVRMHVQPQYTPDGSTVINPNPLGETPLAGNTVGFDRSFLREHMPRLEAVFHYRSIDVTAFNETARRLLPNIHRIRPQVSKDAEHRAMSDIRNSIAQFHHYRGHMFVQQDIEIVLP